MSTHKHIDKICLAAALLAVVLCAVFMNGEALGVLTASEVMGYEDRLFDTSKVHTIDIIIDDWDEFLSTAQSEEYSVCSVVIDGETISNVGIRGKGNTSLSTVAGMDSDRYSFKIEFDQYDSTKTYHGLDKLSLNNIIQDNTYMKDYLSYQMMGEFDVPTPLCSYAYITVNGEDWGLYLAVEAVEESFLQRNYGSNYGDLYKPDSMNMGGGRGNGKDFDMNDFANQQNSADAAGEKTEGGIAQSVKPGGFVAGGFSLDEETVRKAFEELNLDASILDAIDFENITMETIQTVLAGLDDATMQKLMEAVMGSGGMKMPDMGGGGFGGMDSSGTKLQYVDDDPDSYSTIFESAKTNVTDADQARLIASLKQLSEYTNLEEVVNIEDVLRYFVVHNFVVNDDSYTGSMIHNYYLYEENGQLSMIPWDYNLAFGTFQGNNAGSAVNDDIDEVLSDRPMQAWIFSDESYSRRYYELYAELLDQVDVQAIIDNAYKLIASYVEKDPTAFCTYEEFQTGVETLKQFCALRSDSVQRQLSGNSETVDVGDLNLSDMGTMGGGMGGFGGRDFGNRGNSDSDAETNGDTTPQQGGMQFPDNMQLPDGVQSGGMAMPDGMQIPDGTGSNRTDESAQNKPAQGNGNPAESSSQDAPFAGVGNFGNFSPSGEMPDFGNMGEFAGVMSNDQAAGTGAANIILLAVSILFLALGLIVAFRFKR